MMRVVIDTNVWLSALLWGGQPSLIIELIEHQQIQAINALISRSLEIDSTDGAATQIL